MTYFQTPKDSLFVYPSKQHVDDKQSAAQCIGAQDLPLATRNQCFDNCRIDESRKTERAGTNPQPQETADEDDPSCRKEMFDTATSKPL